MKRFLLAFAALLLVCIGIVFVLSHSEKLISPLKQMPSNYDLIKVLEKNNMSFTTPIRIEGAILASVSGILVSFSPEKDFSAQVRALQLVLPKVKMDGKMVSEIDLRFNKVVIKYAER